MVLNYFKFGSNAPANPEDPKQQPVRALPASWYNTKEMYEFERRAIFSKRWLFMTHKVRLANTGDWLRYTFAGFDIIINKDRQGNINAFHNVCRHRAYPVIEKEGSGNAKILACRYHGWSYGLNGKLAKAPAYDGLELNKEENSLFRCHVKIDRNGFIWINLDANEVPEVPWEKHFDNVDVQDRYEGINFDDYVLDHSYDIDGAYNWKILSDNFNECYHCPTTHPDIPTFLNLESFDSDLKDGHIQHHCDPKPEQVAAGLHAHSTYYFPNSSMTVARAFIMIQKFMPNGPNQSKMAYEIYRHKNADEESFKAISEPYARVMNEDKVLCMGQQSNLDRNVFTNGLLHPKWEKAPIFFQAAVRGGCYRALREGEGGR
ncbi:uncharacterized protein N0V89_001420 [Didymosphaeria variabile]|uniref:Choline monooxygenase, chloroplastic n=1 Tax=Didymosphaeria variabile TaxID=1932322 RepID=A0A9W8XWJ1_9PLEO|nr:uncharacterized protein N0V89_001420 [Didymosphaeria variabile]KAJ4360853.1 hypothetical protein N0V89_001420 [Didymosphaeria variabile]